MLDTHILVWAADDPQRLSPRIASLLEDSENDLFFSVASLWELAIKNGTHKLFQVDVGLLRSGLQASGYAEIQIRAEHAMAVNRLPQIHKDPFDRLLVAQAQYEGMMLVTEDHVLKRYHGVYA